MPRYNPTQNEAAIRQRLIAMGLSRPQIAAILGRIRSESYFNPVGDGGRIDVDGHPSIGLFNAGPEVWRQWQRYATTHGISIYDPAAQVEFYVNYFETFAPQAYENFISAEDPISAGKAWRDWNYGGNPGNRDDRYAQEYYESLPDRELQEGEWQSTPEDRRFLPDPMQGPLSASVDNPGIVLNEPDPFVQFPPVNAQGTMTDPFFSWPDFQSNIPAPFENPNNDWTGTNQVGDYNYVSPIDNPEQDWTGVDYGIEYTGDPVAENLGQPSEAGLINPIIGEPFVGTAPPYVTEGQGATRPTGRASTGNTPPPPPQVRRGIPVVGSITEHNAQLGSPSNILLGVGERTGVRYYNDGRGWMPLPTSMSAYAGTRFNMGTGQWESEYVHDANKEFGGADISAGTPNMGGARRPQSDSGPSYWIDDGRTHRVLNSEGGFDVVANSPMGDTSWITPELEALMRQRSELLTTAEGRANTQALEDLRQRINSMIPEERRGNIRVTNESFGPNPSYFAGNSPER